MAAQTAQRVDTALARSHRPQRRAGGVACVIAMVGSEVAVVTHVRAPGRAFVGLEREVVA